MAEHWTIVSGDALTVNIPRHDCVVTSPPYFQLRDYGVDGQIGQEPTVDDYLAGLVVVFRRIRDAMSDAGTLFINLGDTYRDGCALMVPARLAIALSDDGWYLRNELIWHRNRIMPESVSKRFTRSHEMVYFFSKSKEYTFNADAVREEAKWADDPRAGKGRHVYRESRGDGAHTAAVSIAEDGKRNRRSVWTIETEQKSKHHATYPVELPRLCIMAGSNSGDAVLDPFCGTGTTGEAAIEEGRSFVGIELSPDNAALSRQRLGNSQRYMSFFQSQV